MDIVVRASVMFAVLFLLLRVLGKHELAEMTPFELVLLVTMGDLIQQGITHNDYSLTGATLAIATFGFWAFVLNWISFRSRRAERVLDGQPSIIVRQGELVLANVRQNRLTRSEIESEMRMAGFARLAKIEWAIMETNGKISFIPAADGSGTPAQRNDDTGE